VTGLIFGAQVTGSIEDLCYAAYGKWVNPNIQCRALKIPPRKTEDDICCVWEWKMEDRLAGIE
jgi:hypothetical protein